MQLPNLRELDLSGNRLLGDISSAIGSLQSLWVLNLSSNNFSGVIPSTIGSLLMLRSLDLSQQNLTGALPIELAGLPNLQFLSLAENKFYGSIPEGFSSLISLRRLNLSVNNLSGPIPGTLGFLQAMISLSLSRNNLSGSIPVEELANCSSLVTLDLRYNQLQGRILSQIGHLTNLRELDLGNNRLSGNIPSAISNCTSLESVALDGNNLTGTIPKSVGRLKNLRKLFLERNSLSGSIPSELGDGLATNLEELDLSTNNLSGKIPAALSKIHSLRLLNLSRNHLRGEIPATLAARFNASSFAFNSLLCGVPLNTTCQHRHYEHRHHRHGKRAILLIAVAVACGALFLVSATACLVICLVKMERKRRRLRETSGEQEKKLIMFYNPISYANALEATGHFDEEHVLSRTRYGIVFKACLQDGTVLSIRRLVDGPIEESVFRREAEALGKVKHRNLTVLRGYYVNQDVRLLVYDYMPNGNLATLLQEASHQDGHVLNWPMRHLIALGIARGLAFLHTNAHLTIIHGDVKPNNVQFDADFEAHLSDFGLDRLAAIPADPSSSAPTPAGSLGYVSPEINLTGQMTKESDVYSFGIVLLELLTGRRPVMFTQDEDIVKWVKRQLQTGQISELFDPSLLELDPESSEWEEFLLAVKVALLCTAPDPLDRPSMTEVVFMLEGCRVVVVGPDIPSSSGGPTSQTSPV